MSRTDDFKEEETKTSYKDYSLRVSSYEERQRVRNILKDIPQNTTFDRDAQDRGLESGDTRISQITVRAQEYFKQWIGRVVEIEDSDNFVAKSASLRIDICHCIFKVFILLTVYLISHLCLNDAVDSNHSKSLKSFKRMI